MSFLQQIFQHIADVHLPKVLKCNFCKGFFSTAQVLNRHLHSRHSNSAFGKAMHQCQLCGYQTDNIKTLKGHLARAEKMNFQCKICLKRFSCRKLMFEHTKEKRSKTIKCIICKKKRKKTYFFTWSKSTVLCNANFAYTYQ
jgi:hypothetical protein